jgi:hypothetical protein
MSLMYIEKIFKKIIELFNSKYFLGFILLLVFFQGLWYAVNFRPSILDEGRHIGFIELYADRVNPFISSQNEESDFLGETTRDPSYFYYYFLSVPQRITEQITDSYRIQVTVLRIIHILVFALGVFIYDKFFRKLGFASYEYRPVLLFLVLTPAIAVLPGAVNYDSFVFLMSGLLLLQAAKLLKNKSITINDLLIYALIFLTGLIIKYTFIVLSVPVTIYLVFKLLKRKKLGIAKSIKTAKTYILIFAVLALGMLVAERHVYNLVKYQDLTPSCIKIKGEDRCYKNYVQARNIDALNRKPADFNAKNLYEYTFSDWVPNMVYTQVRLNPWDTPSKILHSVYFALFFGGLVAILIYLRDILKKENLKFILLTSTFFGSVLLLTNHQSYVKLGEVVATSSRYLLPVQPLFMIIVLYAVSKILGKRYRIKLLLLALLFISFIFGGGILTYNRTVPDNLYWSRDLTSTYSDVSKIVFFYI